MSNAKLSKEEYNALLSALGDYLEAGHGAACMDDAEDRLRVAEGVVNWLLADRADVSTEALLPKARYFMSFLVVDEATGEHIVRMTLRKSWDMADGDFLSLQNTFWSIVGRAIRDDVALRRRLEEVGVEVDTECGTEERFA